MELPNLEGSVWYTNIRCRFGPDVTSPAKAGRGRFIVGKWKFDGRSTPGADDIILRNVMYLPDVIYVYCTSCGVRDASFLTKEVNKKEYDVTAHMTTDRQGGLMATMIYVNNLERMRCH